MSLAALRLVAEPLGRIPRFRFDPRKITTWFRSEFSMKSRRRAGVLPGHWVTNMGGDHGALFGLRRVTSFRLPVCEIISRPIIWTCLRNARSYLELDNFIFVHAGI